jgi:heme/copper-type cytochrome/quinol oxidase subunit 1
MNGAAPAAVLEKAPAAESERSLFAWIATIDHKRIGILYLVTTLFFFGVGGIEALLIRLQVARPNNTLLSPDAFNQIFTMHGTTMILLVVMPVLIGFANYLVPLMIGARDMAFPRLNAMSYWLLLFGGLLLLWNIWTTLRQGEPAGDNTWNAWTLEWATSSPPPEHNFDQVPPVNGRRPLWDLTHPENPDTAPGVRPLKGASLRARRVGLNPARSERRPTRAT